jgi:hypothetical protein
MAAGSMAGGMMAKSGADAAGATAANAGRVASESLIKAGDAAAQGSYQNAEAYLPWSEPGLAAYNQMAGLSTGDGTAQANALAAVQGSPAWQMQHPWMKNQGDLVTHYGNQIGHTFNASPSYQFRLDQGRNALANSGSARGMTMSGAQAQALTDYNQKSASQEYDTWLKNYADYTDRLTNYNTMGINLGRGATDDYYKNLQYLSGTGYDATKAGVDVNQQGNAYSFKGHGAGTDANLQGQNALARSQAAGAASMAQGVSGAANAIGGAVGGMGGGMGSMASRQAAGSGWTY